MRLVPDRGVPEPNPWELRVSRLTTHVNDLVRPIHDRMPVLVARESCDVWLDLETPEARLVRKLRSHPADEMQVVEVGSAVNSPKADGPECREAA
jgi:putative SOS response-associated peptidase YedK